MKIYIDFDGTLFDTDRQFKDFMYVCNNYGITEDVFLKEVNLVFKGKNFNIQKVIKCLVDKYNISGSINSDINKLFNESYLYSDVLSGLQELIQYGHELFLLTYGDFNFQKRKITSSKISDYFKEIIITDVGKAKLGLDRENSVFIDNNPKEICNLHNSGYSVIRIKRDTDKYSTLNTNISEVTECIDFKQVVDLMKGNVKE